VIEFIKIKGNEEISLTFLISCSSLCLFVTLFATLFVTLFMFFCFSFPTAQWKMNATGYPDPTSEKILVPYGTVKPFGLCVDIIHQDIFYIVGGHGGQLRCVSYDSTPCHSEGPVVQDILNYPYMCAVDSTFVPYGGPTNVVFTQANLPGQIFYTAAIGGDKHSLNKTDIISNNDLQAPEGVALGCLAAGN